MNDEQLEGVLKSLEIARPDPPCREKALQRAKAELQASRSVPPIDNQLLWRRIAWVAVPVAATLAVVIFIPSRFTGPHEHGTRRIELPFVGVDDTVRILHELRMLFPDRLQAVIVGFEGIDIRLHENSTIVSDQPILVELTAPGGEAQQVISFSGETIETVLDNRPLCLELLATGDDGVLITGEGFVWTEKYTLGASDLHIRARLLKSQL